MLRFYLAPPPVSPPTTDTSGPPDASDAPPPPPASPPTTGTSGPPPPPPSSSQDDVGDFVFLQTEALSQEGSTTMATVVQFFARWMVNTGIDPYGNKIWTELPSDACRHLEELYNSPDTNEDCFFLYSFRHSHR